MRNPLTIARTMPTILRLPLDEVDPVLSERVNIVDMGTRTEMVDKLSALGCGDVRGLDCRRRRRRRLTVRARELRRK